MCYFPRMISPILFQSLNDSVFYYMNIYIVIGVFTFVLLYTIWFKKWIVSSYLISVYLVTLLTSLTIEEIFPFFTDSREGSVIYVCALALFILPYIRNTPQIVCYNSPSLHKICMPCTPATNFHISLICFLTLKLSPFFSVDVLASALMF